MAAKSDRPHEIADASSAASAAATTMTTMTHSSTTAAAIAAATGAPTATLLVLDASLARRLAVERFGATYVGCRRIRPSSHLVKEAMKEEREQRKRQKRQKKENAEEGVCDESSVDEDDGSRRPSSSPRENGSKSDGDHGRDDDEKEKEAPDAAAAACAAAPSPTMRTIPVVTEGGNSIDRFACVKFVIVDPGTGRERRMTSSEKKAWKQRHKKFLQCQRQRERQKLLQKQEMKQPKPQQSASLAVEEAGAQRPRLAPLLVTDGKQEESMGATAAGQNDDGYYSFPFPQVAAALREEIADLRGEREGVPPVALSFGMMLQAFWGGYGCLSPPPSSFSSSRSLPRHLPDIVVNSAFDPELSARWAQILADRVKRAEAERDRDRTIRKMPYSLEPEPWKRRRPALVATTATTTTTPRDGIFPDTNGEVPRPAGLALSPTEAAPAADPIAPTTASPDRSWIRFDCGTSSPSEQQSSSTRALHDAAVVHVLHRNTTLHLSCGAKFGCDYLLYEGPRHDHHAFAGLRIIEPAQLRPPVSDGEEVPTVEFPPPLPVPDPCDLAGYVRGLNTAGKLALLATVVPDVEGVIAAPEDWDPIGFPPSSSSYRVAIVDLALKKIRATAFRGASGTVTPKVIPKRPGTIAPQSTSV